MPKLIVFPGAENQYELDLSSHESVAIGRDPASRVVVPRRMASRHHAVIERRSGRYYIRDTESYNSTFVNNRPVREAELIHGDEIRIADRVVRFVEFDGGVESEPGDTLSLPQAPVELALDDLALSEIDTPPVDRLRTPRAAEDTDPALRTGILGSAEISAAIAGGRPKAGPSVSGPTSGSPTGGPISASSGASGSAPATSSRASSSESGGRPAASPAHRPTPRATPAAKPLVSRAQIAVLILSLTAVVAGVARIYLRANDDGRNGGDSGGITPTPTALTADYAALAHAMELTGEAKIDGLWQFLGAYPTSQHRELAYLQLLEAGASEMAVCDHAEREDPALVGEGSALRFRCRRP